MHVTTQVLAQQCIYSNAIIKLLIFYFQRVGIQMDRFDDLIFTLNNESYLLKKGGKTYQLQTAG